MTGTGRANLRQLAEVLNLSVTTVSRALKDGPEVHPDTILRVKVAAEAVGYVPNLHGRALRTGSTKTLTAILPLETRDYLADIAKLPLIEGMTLAARDRGYSLTIFSATPEESPHDNITKVLQSGAADGIIITRMLENDPRINFLKQRRVPFIAFGRSELAQDYAFIDIDNEKIAYEATLELLARGCRSIALQLLTREDQYSAMRLRGYSRALGEYGVQFDPRFVGEEDFTIDASERWLQGLLSLPNAPTGLVSASELGLLGALSALRRQARTIGRDFHIIARDNTRIARYLSVPIVAHSVDMVKVGRALVEGLVTQIEQPQAPLTREVISAEIVKFEDVPIRR